MFESLSERLGGVFERLTKQGALTAEDVKVAMREVRTALLEADVSLPVVREFVKKVEAYIDDSLVAMTVGANLGEPGGPELVPVSLVARASTASPQLDPSNRT